MENVRIFSGFFKSVVTIVLFTSCITESPISVNESGNNNQNFVDFRSFSFENFAFDIADNTIFPQSSSIRLSYVNKRKGYRGGMIIMINGSSLTIPRGALKPPQGLEGQSVTITMAVEKDSLNNSYIYSFSPHGCVFTYPAKIWLSWKDLGVDVPNLYYLDEFGNYIESLPDNINIYDKLMCIEIDHFSRYAVAYSN